MLAVALLPLLALVAAADTSPRTPGFQPSRIGLIRAIIPRNGAGFDACFSADGKWLAVAGGRERVKVISTATWKVAKTIGAEGVGAFGCAISPDSKSLLLLDANAQTRLYDLGDGRELWLTASNPMLSHPRFSPDGRRVLVPSMEGGASVVDVATGRVESRIGAARDPMYDACFTRDGSRLLISTVGGRFILFQASAWKELRSWAPPGAGTAAAALSPDGRIAATGHCDGGLHTWNPETGEELQSIKAHTGPILGMVFTPDSRHLLTGGGIEGKIWETRTWTEEAVLLRHRNQLRGIALSPSGVWVATFGHDQVVNIWGPSLTPGTIRPRAFLGVGIRSNGTVCELNEIRAGFPAERAGLKVNDQLLEIDGEAVNEYSEAVAMIGSHVEGDEVAFKIRRDGKEFTVRIKLTKRPDNE